MANNAKIAAMAVPVTTAEPREPEFPPNTAPSNAPIPTQITTNAKITNTLRRLFRAISSSTHERYAARADTAAVDQAQIAQAQ